MCVDFLVVAEYNMAKGEIFVLNNRSRLFSYFIRIHVVKVKLRCIKISWINQDYYTTHVNGKVIDFVVKIFEGITFIQLTSGVVQI